jgi:hypothetical protein
LRAAFRAPPKAGLRSTPQAALVFEKRADNAQVRGFALKTLAVGPRVEETKMLTDANPVGAICSLENSGHGARGQSVGWSEHVKSIAVEASQSFPPWKPDKAFGIDHNLADGRMESIPGGEYGGGQLLGEGGEYCQAGDGTTLGEVPESCASGERLHLNGY